MVSQRGETSEETRKRFRFVKLDKQHSEILTAIPLNSPQWKNSNTAVIHWVSQVLTAQIKHTHKITWMETHLDSDVTDSVVSSSPQRPTIPAGSSSEPQSPSGHQWRKTFSTLIDCRTTPSYCSLQLFLFVCFQWDTTVLCKDLENVNVPKLSWLNDTNE